MSSFCPDTKLTDNMKRWLRASELIRKYSRDQSFVYITAPYPDKNWSSRAYLSLLEVLSESVAPTP